jgi:nicotinamidase-related amidase
VISVQVNMFAEGNTVFDGEKILHLIRHLITQAHAAHLPVFYVQNKCGEGDPDMTGTTGWQIHPEVPRKWETSSFKNTCLTLSLKPIFNANSSRDSFGI